MVAVGATEGGYMGRMSSLILFSWLLPLSLPLEISDEDADPTSLSTGARDTLLGSTSLR